MKAYLLIVVLVLLVGCVPKKRPVSLPPELPAISRTIKQAAFAPVLPERTITLAWDYDTNIPQITFNVYSAPIPLLSAMRRFTNVAGTSITLLATNDMQFFQVKAMDQFGYESDWATK